MFHELRLDIYRSIDFRPIQRHCSREQSPKLRSIILAGPDEEPDEAKP
jgi:hypothetical protein